MRHTFVHKKFKKTALVKIRNLKAKIFFLSNLTETYGKQNLLVYNMVYLNG